MTELVLASASPRRAALLRQIGLPFRVDASQGEEEDAGPRGRRESPEAYAMRLALAKARAVMTARGRDARKWRKAGLLWPLFGEE